MPSWKRIREFSKRLPKSDGDSAPNVTPLFGPQLTISIGTPEQGGLGCNLDTTSGDTWIVDVNAANLPDHEKYYFWPKNSTSLTNSNYPYESDVVDIDGLHARITGTIAQDLFDVFGNGQFSLRFGLIESVVPSGSFAQIPDTFAAGRCGFGFAASDDMDLFLPALLANENLKSLTAMLYECTTDTQVAEAIEMAGFIDPLICNTSTTVTTPLSDRSNWNFAINGYTIGDLTSTKRQIVTMNTRELLTGVPADVYNYVYKFTNATIDDKYAWPIVECKQQFPDLHINVGGDDVSVTPELYIFEGYEKYNLPCHLMLYPLNGGGFLPSWSFGYIWMYKKCITFDYYNRQMSFTDYNRGLCDQK